MFFVAFFCFLFFIGLIVSLVIIFRMINIMIEIENATEKSLDICDESYGRISRLLELPVALASPEVRHVLQEITRVRDSILLISNILADPYDGVEEDDDDLKGKKEKE